MINLLMIINALVMMINLLSTYIATDLGYVQCCGLFLSFQIISWRFYNVTLLIDDNK